MTAKSIPTMDRPASITHFEQLWFASIAFWAAATLLSWNRVQNSLLGDPRTLPVADWAQPFWVGTIAVASLLPWWLVTRRASGIARWLIVMGAAIGGLRMLLTLASLVTGGRSLHALAQGSAVIAALLAIFAAAALFAPDARAWFGDDAADDDVVSVDR